MAVTAQNLIIRSMKIANIIGEGETPSTEMLNDGLTALNDMLDSWSNENLTIYATAQDVFTLVPGTRSYTMGLTGVWNVVRPLRLDDNCYIRDINGVDYPLSTIEEDQYDAISFKGIGARPQLIWPTGDYPLQTIFLWPVPVLAEQIFVNSFKPLTTPAALATTVDFPHGYQRALHFNLAKELLAEYAREVHPQLADAAAESKANIKRTNIQRPVMATDDVAMSGGTFNIFTGM